MVDEISSNLYLHQCIFGLAFQGNGWVCVSENFKRRG
jgi:hypothetical protein